MNALRILCISFKIFLEFFMEKEKKLLISLTTIYIFYEVVSKLFKNGLLILYFVWPRLTYQNMI